MVFILLIFIAKELIIAFAKPILPEPLYAESCVPFTHINNLAMQTVDLMTSIP
ncbi:MAG: hypothetical protein SNJ71_05760 [Bacteroidales bacterium]